MTADAPRLLMTYVVHTPGRGLERHRFPAVGIGNTSMCRRVQWRPRVPTDEPECVDCRRSTLEALASALDELGLVDVAAVVARASRRATRREDRPESES